MIKQRYDGRDLNITPWESQKTFQLGYHYKPSVEDAVRGLELLEQYQPSPPVLVQYPDLRNITIEE